MRAARGHFRRTSYASLFRKKIGGTRPALLGNVAVAVEMCLRKGRRLHRTAVCRRRVAAFFLHLCRSIQEHPMRSAFAFILAIAVTVGAAYVHDKYDSSAGTKQLVNWQQLSEGAQTLVDSAREQWGRLTTK